MPRGSGYNSPRETLAFVPENWLAPDASGSYVFSAGIIFAKAQYAVARDGRFLMNLAEDVTAPPITLVVNWATGFTD